MNIQLQEQIIDGLNNLDVLEQTEVLDFIEFLTYKKKNITADVTFVDSLFGKYQQKIASSTEFARRKQNEIAHEEAKWQ